MAKFRCVISVEAITFEEFIDYGLKHANNIVNDRPWFFTYENARVTHETDECYLIVTNEGENLTMTVHDVLVKIDGSLIVCDKDLFYNFAERIDL